MSFTWMKGEPKYRVLDPESICPFASRTVRVAVTEPAVKKLALKDGWSETTWLPSFHSHATISTPFTPVDSPPKKVTASGAQAPYRRSTSSNTVLMRTAPCRRASTSSRNRSHSIWRVA
jgi:hypothetical protein